MPFRELEKTSSGSSRNGTESVPYREFPLHFFKRYHYPLDDAREFAYSYNKLGISMAREELF